MLRMLARYFPTKERLLANHWLKPLSGRMADPAHWRMTRRSVRLGVAIGLFSGFILPLGQIPLAICIGLSFRANLLVASITTLITNPITFPFIYIVAYQLGERGLNFIHLAYSALLPDVEAATPHGVIAPLAIGLTLLSIGGSITGFFATDVVWRHRTHRRWAARPHRKG